MRGWESLPYYQSHWKYYTHKRGRSDPDMWKTFFETYMRNEICKIPLDNIPYLEINVKKDLALFAEQNLMYALYNDPDKAIADALEGLKKAHIPTAIDTDKIASEELMSDKELIENVRLKFVNLSKFRRFKLKELSYELLNKFFAIEGVVRAVSQPKPRIVEPYYECEKCCEVVTGDVKRCPTCGSRSLRLDLEKSKMTNCQKIVIQELPENMDSGEQPTILEAYLFDDMVGVVRAGDKVVLNGILRPKQKRGKPDLDYWFEVNSVEFIQEDIRNLTITAEDERKIRELASRPDIYDLLVKSLAPSIYGNEEVKLACILALFGGVPRQRKDGTRVRGDIHVLIVGDPSLAKSQLLRALKEIAPRAILTTGYTSSGAGLTVTVVKDEDNRWTIEAGALVLADKGIALIDELEKMGKDDRKYVLEALEQQSITVAKAGINATLNSRCTVIAVANPKGGRFNKFQSLPEQIDLEPPLISRFDLIFFLMDEPNEETDEKMANHILMESDDVEPMIPPELLRKYVAYARQTVTKVKLTREAAERLKSFYLELRKMSKEEGCMAITVRQLEALVRLTQASAKVQLRDLATVEDAERAIKLFRKCMEQVAVDPETGKFDIDYAFTGTSATQRDRIAIIRKIIEELQETTKYGAPEEDIFRVAEEEYRIPRGKVEEILQKLRNNGEVMTPRYGFYKVVN